MTKTIVIGQQTSPKCNPKPIEFIKHLNCSWEFDDYILSPRHYNYVELICKDYTNSSEGDLIFVYDNPKRRDKGLLYIGKWNDGFVE
jgi:hypothetical protein